MFFLYNRVSLLPGTYDRYLIRELLLTLLAVSVALVLVLASNRLIRYLGEVVGGRLPGDLVLTLLGYKSLEYLDQLLPIALYLAILLLLGRLYRDREMAVLAAGGVATSRLLRPLLFVALPMMLVQLAVSFQFAPWAVRQQVAVEDELARRSDIAALQPGRFLESRRGFRVLYVEAMDENQEQFEQLFVHQLHLDGRFSVYASSRGGVVVDRENGVRYLEMEEGAIYEGRPGEPDYRIVHYDRYRLLVDEGEPLTTGAGSHEAMGLDELLSLDDRAAWIELQWRFAGVAGTLIFVLISVPLSRVAPRQGRFGRLALALLLYLTYYNLFGATRGLAERGELPVVVGVWGVPLLFALTAALLWLIESGLAGRWWWHWRRS